MANTADVVRFFTAKHVVYDRFIRWVGYPQGLRAFLEQSRLLQSDLRVLHARCGTGALTIAPYEAFVRKSIAPRTVDAFDLTPAMLQRPAKHSDVWITLQSTPLLRRRHRPPVTLPLLDTTDSRTRVPET